MMYKALLSSERCNKTDAIQGYIETTSLPRKHSNFCTRGEDILLICGQFCPKYLCFSPQYLEKYMKNSTNEGMGNQQLTQA